MNIGQVLLLAGGLDYTVKYTFARKIVRTYLNFRNTITNNVSIASCARSFEAIRPGQEELSNQVNKTPSLHVPLR